MTRLFISHSSKDDEFVRELRTTLADHGHDGWIDSRELRGGDPLWPEIQQAIEDADAYAVVVSTDGLQSKWVGKELRHALELRKNRGNEKFPVIPLSLNDAKLGVLEEFFDDEPLYIPVSSDAGGVEAAMNGILVAMRLRDPADVISTPQPKAEPLEELVLELTDLKFHEQDGVRRASARARLVYEPATHGQPPVHSVKTWRLVAPIGPIEAEELRWYLEKYAIWPSHYFRDRADKVEENLLKWGQLLHEAAMPVVYRENVMQAWAKIDDQSGRRFSVHVDTALEEGAPEDDVNTAKEAATLLLGLPWELMHDGKRYLFQGATPTRVRRRLPGTEAFDVPVVATPIRILLVTARPEDESCGYIDHRASALPLVEAMESLPGLVRMRVLSPPTLSALRDELDRARAAKTPYHVVHFDGHGVYDKSVGLGGLCFELPEDIGKLDNRRHATVFTSELGPLLRDHRIPLVFLEACQTAQAEKASESVASELLKVGVASVVAMSHSVLVETARRFVESFYKALAGGKRVGDAMLAGQRQLKDDTFRGRIFSVGELRLEDWFVPVLFQEKDDPQLFKTTPAKQTVADFQTALAKRLGDLPLVPETGFIGRSRELLALQRLLDRRIGFQPFTSEKGRLEACPTYAVIRGQGGEGKTALAAEFARWMVRSHQMRRAAFVSVETHGNQRAVVDAIGRQLVGKEFSAAGDLEDAIRKVERALREQSTLLVVDNMESVLLPEFIEKDTPAALSEESRRELQSILDVCQQLLKAGDTRLIFTSREALPAPFNSDLHRRELHQLDREDAVKLVERVLNTNDHQPPPQPPGASPRFPHNAHTPPRSTHEPAANAVRLMDAATEQIEQLVDAVHGHARTLALLAPALRKDGVEKTRVSLDRLMAEMEKTFPGSREKSVFASVELSLRRMSAENRDRAQVLGVFHGGVDLDMLRTMMQSRRMDIPVRPADETAKDDGQECPSYDQVSWEEADVASLAVELVQTGLATPNRYNHLTLNPALCPYLREGMTAAASGEPVGVSHRVSSESPPHSTRRLTPSGSPFLESLTTRWIEAMRGYVEFLVQQQNQNAEVAATLTVLELPNLVALLDLVHRAGDEEATIDLATSLYSLLKNLGKTHLLDRVGQVRDAAAATLGDAVNHARFQATRTRIEQQLANGQLREAFDGAQQLLQRARMAGEQAYLGADYDLAVACFLLARVLRTAGGAEQALPLLDEARQRFETIATVGASKAAEKMASDCITEQGNCLLGLGRLDEAAAAYEEAIARSEQLGAARDVAVGKGQLGTVRLDQRRYPDALAAHAEARERFTQLDEPGSVAVSWHQTGMVYQEAGQPEAAEDAYRKSLAIKVRLGNVAGQASTLGQLGNLYDDLHGRFEEAATLSRQAADKYATTGDLAGEGIQRDNLGNRLRKLRRLDEARQEIHRAIECKSQFGHASAPWMSWFILANIETDAGNLAAAAEAKGKAIASYLAYRRAGGENHSDPGRLFYAVTLALREGDTGKAEHVIAEYRESWKNDDNPEADTLQAIVAGSRDRTLADAPDLNFSMAAELLFLIETLEQPRQQTP